MIGALRFLLNPVQRLLIRFIPVDDPWERFPHNVPLRVFGVGAQRDFAWYFEGESAVTVTSVDEIQEWLLGCEYATDMHVFQSPDYWQHPRTFEQLRKGDCEDHALWAWRKLVELGVDAEFVVGAQLSRAGELLDPPSRHAWVIIRAGNDTLLFETAAKEREHMLLPVDANVRAQYRPEASVDAQRKRHGYFGYALSVREHYARTRK